MLVIKQRASLLQHFLYTVWLSFLLYNLQSEQPRTEAGVRRPCGAGQRGCSARMQQLQCTRACKTEGRAMGSAKGVRVSKRGKAGPGKSRESEGMHQNVQGRVRQSTGRVCI